VVRAAAAAVPAPAPAEERRPRLPGPPSREVSDDDEEPAQPRAAPRRLMGAGPPQDPRRGPPPRPQPDLVPERDQLQRDRVRRPLPPTPSTESDSSDEAMPQPQVVPDVEERQRQNMHRLRQEHPHVFRLHDGIHEQQAREAQQRWHAARAIRARQLQQEHLQQGGREDDEEGAWPDWIRRSRQRPWARREPDQPPASDSDEEPLVYAAERPINLPAPVQRSYEQNRSIRNQEASHPEEYRARLHLEHNLQQFDQAVIRDEARLRARQLLEEQFQRQLVNDALDRQFERLDDLERAQAELNRYRMIRDAERRRLDAEAEVPDDRVLHHRDDDERRQQEEEEEAENSDSSDSYVVIGSDELAEQLDQLSQEFEELDR